MSKPKERATHKRTEGKTSNKQNKKQRQTKTERGTKGKANQRQGKPKEMETAT